MSDQVGSSIRRFLVHDEVESFSSKNKIRDLCCKEIACRVRVWRTGDMQSIVLVSSVEGETSPLWISTTIAMYAMEAILKYDESGMAYFEDDEIKGTGRRTLTLVHFDYFGSEHRRRPYNPQRTKPREWEDFEAIIGRPVKR